MNLLNINKSYIPTSDEMITLSDLIADALQDVASDRPFRAKLTHIQWKLDLLDSIFRAAEQPDWNDYIERVFK